MIAAKESPRIEKGVIYWYERNTFALQFRLVLKNTATGEEVPFEPTDEVLINFRKKNKDENLYSFRCTDVKDNCVVIKFTPPISDLFVAGEYEFGITKNGEQVNTLVACGKVVVEEAV